MEKLKDILMAAQSIIFAFGLLSFIAGGWLMWFSFKLYSIGNK